MKTATVLCTLSLALLTAACDPCSSSREAPRAAEAASGKLLNPGDRVPDFTFTNHEGREVAFSSLRPRAVLTTFIFTRCTSAEFCPRMSLKFRETREALDASAHRDTVELLSVTLDPENDTRELLAAYATSLNAQPGSWTFARCAPEVLSVLKQQFGVRAAPSGPNGAMEHNLITALIGPDGRLQRVWDGNSWTVGEVTAELERASAAGTATIAKRATN